MIRSLLIAMLFVSSLAPAQTSRILFGTRDTGSVTVDIISPSAPSGLSVVAYGTDTIRISWIAPGDDGLIGRATSYSLGYSTSPISTGELISNPGMTTNLSGWIALQGTEQFSYSIYGHNDPGSLRLTSSGSGYEGVLYPVTTNISGSVYFSAWVFYNGPNVSTPVDFYILDQNNGVIGSFSSQPVSRGSWTYLSRTVTASGLQSQIRLGIQFDPGFLGDTLYIDDVSMTNGVSFASVSKATGLPAPENAGTEQLYTLSGLNAATTYYMAMTAVDDKGNVSPISSILSQATRSTTPTPPGGEDTVSTVSTGYYVTTSGNSGNTGKTLGSPWSLTKAIADAGLELGTGYDTVLIEPGTYDVALSPARDGLSTMPIVWKRRGSGEVKIRGVGGSYQTMVLTKNYHVFDGLTITVQDTNSAPPGEHAIMIEQQADHITFKRCRIISGVLDIVKHNFTDGRFFRGMVVSGKYTRILNSYFRGWNMAIVETGSSPRYNTYRNDSIYYSWQSGFNLQTSTDGTTAYMGTLIDSCVVDTSLSEDNIQFEDYTPNLTATDQHRGTIISNSRFGNAAENAIDFKTTGRTFVENCIVYGSESNDDGGYGKPNNSGSGPAIERHNVSYGTKDVTIRYNVVYDNCRAITACGGGSFYNNTLINNRRTYNGPNQTSETWYNLETFENTAPIEFFNNIVATVNGATTPHFIRAYEDPAVWKVNYQLYYDSSGVTRWASNWWTGSAIRTTYYTTLASWRASFGYDANSTVANPQFENTPLAPWGYNASWTFKPASGSPAVNTGRAHAFSVGSGTNSTTLFVSNANLFRWNFGNPDISGDMISIGGGATVEITNIDYATGAVTLASPRSWSNGAAVILTNYVSDGQVDIGGKER